MSAAAPAHPLAAVRRARPLTLLQRESLGGLSFYVIARDARGREVHRCAFDVPAERYAAGWRTGVRAGCEFVRYMRASAPAVGTWPLADIVHEVGRILAAPDRVDDRSRRGAACGFLYVLQQMMLRGAQAVDLEQWHADWLAGQDLIEAKLSRVGGAA